MSRLGFSRRAGFTALSPRVVALCLLTTGVAQPAMAIEEPEFDLEHIFLEEAFDGGSLPSVKWIRGGSTLLVEEDGDWFAVDPRDGRRPETPWLDLEPWDDGGQGEVEADGLIPSKSGRHVILLTNSERRWRRSTVADHWVLDRETGERWRLSQGGRELHPAFSQDGRSIGFVKEGDLHIHDVESRRSRKLTDDADDQVTNGDPDWVYEEEFDFSTAWWFAPDGRSIAYFRFDRRGVERYPLVEVGTDAMPRLQSFDYPKSGAVNSAVQLRVVDLESRRHRTLASVDSATGYLVRADWVGESGQLSFQRVPRDQKSLQLFVIDPDEPASEPVLVLEESSRSWIDVTRDLHFLDDETFLWTSNRSGWRHVYRGRLGSGELEPLTNGEWEVASIVGVGRDHAFLLTHRTRPVDTNLERLDLRGGELTRIGPDRGTSQASVAADAEHLVHTWSRAEVRPRRELMDARGKVQSVLHEDSTPIPGDGVEVVFETIDVEGAPSLWSRTYRPTDMDPDLPRPVLIHVYAGPGANLVTDRWTGKRNLFHRMLVESGWVVVAADGRGSGRRGRDHRASVYRELGQKEIDDQLALVDHLRSQSWVDPARIAIWGWSYGGYASAATLLKSEGRVRAAFSVAPVTDWRFYDTVYTERYMGTPEDNAKGYDAASLLPLADRLEGALALIHGTGDDNVHVQNTHRLVTALVEAGMVFDLMIYPDKAHRIPGKAFQFDVYRRLLEFLAAEVGPREVDSESR